MSQVPRKWSPLGVVMIALVLALAGPTGARGDDSKTVTVRCDRGESVGQALAHHDGVLTISVVGTCDEHVVVNRNDISLVAGAPDAGIHGPDATLNTLQVTGSRFVLDGLTVTGGRNAVVVTAGGRATLRNCDARADGGGIISGIGIVFSQGASGSVDSCTASGNPTDGLLLDAAVATITNSTFANNGRTGILVFNGSTARIGMTDLFVPAGNLVQNNGSTGIHTTLNSMTLLVGNTISGNGGATAPGLGRGGVGVNLSRLVMPGLNTITGSRGSGVFLIGSTAVIGDPGFGLPTANTISGNGTLIPGNGLFVFMASAVTVRNATIQNNGGSGIALSQRSTLTAIDSRIMGNTVDGVQLVEGSAAIFQPPASTVSGNAHLDLQCNDAESSYSGPVAAGTIAAGCTGF
jgi:hypothetical protein